MRNVIIAVLSVSAFQVFGQELTTWEVDSIGTLMANELLLSQRTNEVAVASSGCVGCEVVGDCSCFDGYSTTYLLWEEKSKIWLTSVNCCKDVVTTELKNTDVWNDLKVNRTKIFGSKFKEDYIAIHHYFWLIKVLPNLPTELRTYDYYFEDYHKHHAWNKRRYAYEFRNSFFEAIRQNRD